MKVLAVVVVSLLAAIGMAGGSLARALDGDDEQAQATASKPAVAPEALDKLLAPVALYPDQLLAQMLLCAQKPAKVQELSGWLIRNPELKGTKLQDAAEQAGFEPSFVVLVLFPQVVNFMADSIAWTSQVGEAFTADRQGVLDSVQRLRAQCQKAGNLKTTPQQTVETKTTSSGSQVIVIEPSNPQVVYVPQYNPQVVYTQPATTTVVVQEDDNDAGAAVAGAVVGFAAGIAIGAAIDNDHYYGPYGWHGGPYMYNDAWDDFYDDREDAREDFYENREDAREDLQDSRKDTAESRTERANTAQQERTERQQNRQASGTAATPDQQARRTEARSAAESRGATTASAQARGASAESRGTTDRQRQMASERSGTRSDAFSGYSSGRSERSASARGERSRTRSSSGRSRRR